MLRKEIWRISGKAFTGNYNAPWCQNHFPMTNVEFLVLCTERKKVGFLKNWFHLSQIFYLFKNWFPILNHGFLHSKNGFPFSKNGFLHSKNGFPFSKNGFPLSKNGFPFFQKQISPFPKTDYPFKKWIFPFQTRNSLSKLDTGLSPNIFPLLKVDFLFSKLSLLFQVWSSFFSKNGFLIFDPWNLIFVRYNKPPANCALCRIIYAVKNWVYQTIRYKKRVSSNTWYRV